MSVDTVFPGLWTEPGRAAVYKQETYAQASLFAGADHGPNTFAMN